MLPARRRAVAGAWVAALAGLAMAIRAPGPLFINLGPGDEPFAHAFRGRWERDGSLQAGATTFRWALDGSTLAVPVEIVSGRLEARLRLARFTDSPAEILVRVGDRPVVSWRQHPRGWTQRTLDLGEARGPLRIQIRAEGVDAEGLAVALDWVEIRGAGALWPAPSLLGGMLLLLLGVPVLLGLASGRFAAAAAAGVALALAGCFAVLLDRLGGLVLLGASGVPALIAASALLLLSRLVRWAWPQLSPGRAVVIPLVGTFLALLALWHPFFYYPDVDTHARFLAEMRHSPALAWDPGPYQARVGAWTRELGGVRVGFPYSTVFYLAAWLPALAVGEVAAVKLIAVVAVGAMLLLANLLARLLGLGWGGALLAQALLALLPVFSSRLSLALYPALFGQAFELLLAVTLVTRLQRLDAGHDGLLIAALLGAQFAYTGSIINVGMSIAVLAGWLWICGSPRTAARLVLAWLGTFVLVLGTQYARSLPFLLTSLAPVALTSSAPGGAAGIGAAVAAAGKRLLLFHGPLLPVLSILGVHATRAAPVQARRVLTSLLGAGAVVLLLRYVVPVLFRDAKEVELLAAPVAIFSAAALLQLAHQDRGRRSLAVVIGAGLVLWCGARAVSAYTERFVAVAR